MELDPVTGTMVLAAAAMHATWNAVVKRAADPLVMQARIVGISALCALPFAIALPFPGLATWGWIVAGTIVHGLYFTILVEAYRVGDFSHVYPIARGSGPLLVAGFGALVLGETMAGFRYAGVALISLGIFSLALTAQGGADRRALPYALAVGASIASYTLIDAMGVRSGPEPYGFIAWLLVLSALPICAMALWRRGLAGALRAAKPQAGRALFAGVICGLAYGMVLWAYSQGTLAAIAALRETSVVFAALIGAVLFGEKFGRARILAAALVAVGAAILNLPAGG